VSELAFDCLGAAPERYAAAPTLTFRLAVSEVGGAAVHAIALRCQIRIEPQRRRYSAAEGDRLLDLFGERARWGDTLKPLQFATVTAMVPAFSGSIDVDLPVPLTYDFEVATAKYFYALEEGEIPLILMFSGTVFTKGETGFAVEQVPWHKECHYRLPVKVWQETMDAYFPNTAWIRLHRDSLDALAHFKAHRGLPTWEATLGALLEAAGEAEP
jgi:hypothetical protein